MPPQTQSRVCSLFRTLWANWISPLGGSSWYLWLCSCANTCLDFELHGARPSQHLDTPRTEVRRWSTITWWMNELSPFWKQGSDRPPIRRGVATKQLLDRVSLPEAVRQDITKDSDPLVSQPLLGAAWGRWTGQQTRKEKCNRCVEHGRSHTSDWMASVYRQCGSHHSSLPQPRINSSIFHDVSLLIKWEPFT